MNTPFQVQQRFNLNSGQVVFFRDPESEFKRRIDNLHQVISTKDFKKAADPFWLSQNVFGGGGIIGRYATILNLGPAFMKPPLEWVARDMHKVLGPYAPTYLLNKMADFLPSFKSLSSFRKGMAHGAGAALLIGIPLEIWDNYEAVTNGRRSVGGAVADGALDVGIGVFSASAGTFLGAKIGFVLGSSLPIVGQVAGLAIGSLVGTGIGFGLSLLKDSALYG